MMSVLGLIGIAGVGIYLAAYACLQLGVLRGGGLVYTLMNMTAAASVLISLVEEFSLSAFLIQVSWIVISIVGLVRRYLMHQRGAFTAAETLFARSFDPDVSVLDLRRLMDLGQWTERPAGTILTTQDVPVSDLVFIVRGRADVLRDGVLVGDVTAGNFVGEMTCQVGGPATATTVVSQPIYCLEIPAPRLRSFLSRNPAVQDQLERGFADDLRRKLAASANLVVALSAAPPRMA